MVIPKSQVRPFTTGNFDSCQLCTEKQSLANTEEPIHTAHFKASNIYKKQLKTYGEEIQMFIICPLGGPMVIWPEQRGKEVRDS